MSHRLATMARPRRLAVSIALLIALMAAAAVAPSSSRAAEPIQISDGVLDWGIKTSWRQYARAPVVMAGGVTQHADGTFAFPITAGSYDPETRTTTIRAQGTLQWQSHWYPDEQALYPPPAEWTGSLDIFVLDVTMKDPQLTIGPDGSQLTVEAISRNVSTWELTDLGRVAIVDLDPSAPTVTTTVADGTTAWSGIPAALTVEGAGGVFGGNYAPGQAVDPVGFTYVGDGGAPDFSEQWTAPDSNGLKLAGNGIWADTPTSLGSSPRWVDRNRGIVHETIGSAMRAFDLTTGTLLGEPYVPAIPVNTLINNTAFVDTKRGVRYFSSSATNTIDSTLRWDAGTETYVQAPLPTPFTVLAPRMYWDETHDRAIAIKRVVPTGAAAGDFEAHQWWLATYTRQANGTFVERRYRLPNGPTGWNESWYMTSSYQQLAPPIGVAADGSIILSATDEFLFPQDGVTTAPLTELRAQRIVLHDDSGSASVTDIPGSGVPVEESYAGYLNAFASSDGHVSLVSPGDGAATPTRILQYKLSGDGALTRLGDRVDVAQANQSAAAADPVDGTVWVNDYRGQKITGVRDGRIAFSRTFNFINTIQIAIGTLANRDLWVSSSDGTPAGFGLSTYGYARFNVTGYSPKVTQQPAAASVSLAENETSEAVTFTSTATGTPTPTRRWQIKRPGTGRFVDLAGQSGETLTVAAERGMDATQYRAVYTNAAGALATEAAALSVAYAPRLTGTLADVAVSEGSDATFTVLPDGNPAPTVTWQRRVDGFWQNIGPDDDGFAIDGARLVVTDTNVDQSGALLRAKAANAVASTYSRAATLTVKAANPPSEEPVELGGVTLDWTGSQELQSKPPLGDSNFLSAGVSDGKQSTYSAAGGNVAVYQVSASGTEIPASWATRGAHVAGGGKQLVRLSNGRATLRPDGSATVSWTGAFSVNFYDGLLPFAITNPVLNVTATGTGTLSAGQLSGYASSQANPNQREPLAPATNVVFATFSGVHIDPAGKVTVTPDYAGVTVAIPNTPGLAQQDRTTPGWGAWPQPFVDFQLQTGLSSYWYSSGGAADPNKPPAPFVVDFTNAGPVTDTPPPGHGGGTTNPPAGAGGGTSTPSNDPEATTAPSTRDTAPTSTPAAPTQASPSAQFDERPVITARVARQRIGSRGTATVASVACGSRACRVTAPKTVQLRIAGRTYRARVVVSKATKDGKVTVRLRLPTPAIRALAGRQVRVDVRLSVSAGGAKTSRTATVTLAGAKKTRTTRGH